MENFERLCWCVNPNKTETILYLSPSRPLVGSTKVGPEVEVIAPMHHLISGSVRFVLTSAASAASQNSEKDMPYSCMILESAEAMNVIGSPSLI